MITSAQLTELFGRLENAATEARVSFSDGNVYDLKILSTCHAEAGGDIVADVVRSIQSDGAGRWESGAMNFNIEDVVRVEAGDECLFTKVYGEPDT